MSNIIDERVAKLSFDGEQFQSGIGNAMTTLGKFQEVIGKANSSSLTGLQDAASKVSFSGLESTMDQINNRFSLLGVAAMTTVQNVVNKAVDGGQRIISALTIDPVKSGMSEYEEKINSVQTILMGAKNKDGTAVSLQQVKDKLEELNVYADKTIYSFEDMTTNIGKFTNAGVDLDTAVAAIQGISNEAAVSGANANEASRAMYNFAQALSSGSVKLIDWKSIENANMATVEFKQELLDTAVALGTVVKEGDKYKSTTKDNKGKVSEAFSATEKFNDALSSQWMTTEVLTTTLGRYADENTKIGKKAFAAAQEVKTLSQLWDTLKEAAQSGWGATWEYIIGDFEEAKKLWTEVSNVVGGFIDKQSKARNDVLKVWHDDGGRKAVLKGMKNLFKGVNSILEPIEDAFGHVFDAVDPQKLIDASKKFKEFTKKLTITEKTSARIETVFTKIFTVIKNIGTASKNVFGKIPPAVNAVKDALNIHLSGEGFLTIVEFLDEIVASSNKLVTFTENLGFTEEQSEHLNTIFSGIGESLMNIGGGLVKTGKAIFSFVKGLGSAVASSGALYSVTSLLANVLSVIASGLSMVANASASASTIFSGLLVSAIDKVFTVFSGLAKLSDIFKSVFTSIAEIVRESMTNISAMFEGVDFGRLLDGFKLAGIFALVSKVKEFLDLKKEGTEDGGGLFSSIKGVFESLSGVGEEFKNVLESVSDAIESFAMKNQAEAIMDIAKALAILAASIVVLASVDAEKVQSSMSTVVAMIGILMGVVIALERLQKFTSAASKGDGLLTSLMSNVMGSTTSRSLQNIGMAVVELAVGLLILTSSVEKLSDIPKDKLINGLLSAIVLMSVLADIMKKLPANPNVTGVIAMSAAVYILSSSIKKMSDIPPMSLLYSLLAVISLMLYAVAALQQMPTDVKGTGALIGISAALYIMSMSIKRMSSLPIDSMAVSVLSILVLIVALEQVAERMSKIPVVEISTMASLIVMAEAVKILGGVVNAMSQLKPNQLGAGVLAIGVLLLEMTTALEYLSSMGNGKSSIAGAISLMIVANALILVSAALQVASGIGESAIGGIFVIGGALAVMAVGLQAFSKVSMKGAAALLIMSIAIGALVPVFGLLAGLDLQQILTIIAGIGMTLLVLAAASMGISSIAPQMVIAAGAILAFSVSLMSLGLAASLLVAPLAMFVSVLMPVGAAISNFVSSIVTFVKNLDADGVLNLILGIAVAIAGLIVACMALSMASSFIVTAAIALGLFGVSVLALGLGLTAVSGAIVIFAGALAAIAQLGPSIASVFVTLAEGIKNFVITLIGGIGDGIQAIVEGMDQWGPLLVNVMSSLIRFMVQGMLSQVELLASAAVTILDVISETIMTKIGPIIQSGIDIALAFIQGVATGIRDNTEAITSVVGNLFISIGELILTMLARIVEAIPGVGGMLADKLNGMKEQLDKGFDENAIKEKTKEATEGAAEGVEEATPELENSVDGMGDILNGASFDVDLGSLKDQGLEIPESIASGINSGSGDVDSALNNLMSGSADSAIDLKAFKGAGTSDVQALTNAISSSSSKKKANTAGKNVAQSSSKGANSSSIKGDFSKAGNNYVSGLTNSITSSSNMSKAYNAGHSLGSKAKKGYDDATKTMSPSREMYKRGGYFVDGLVNGIMHFAHKAENASAKMGTNAVYSLQKAISSVPDVIQDRMNSDVTIRPVMDLSDVQNGVNEINRMQNGLGEFALNTSATYDKALNTRASMNTGASDMTRLLKAVSGLKEDMGKNRGNSYVINGVNYSEGSKVSEAIGALVHAITVEGRA